MKILPVRFIIGFFKGFFEVFKMLFKKNITLSYPEEKYLRKNNFKGRVFLNCDQQDNITCIGCQLCQKVCPVKDLIKIEKHRDSEGKIKITKFEIDISRCIFCGNCQDNCPVKCIELGSSYELSTFDKNLLTLNIDELKLKNESV